jgi:hypothetical protein
MKRLRQINHAILVAILASPHTLVGADSQLEANRIAKSATGKQWHVKYMGGPTLLRRGTPVDLAIGALTVSYRARGREETQESSIPVTAVTDVSDEIIEGNLSEKVFGPGETDSVDDLGVPCAEWALGNDSGVGGEVVASGCLAGSLALEVSYGLLDSFLSNIPFKDHFLRIFWQEGDKVLGIVFKVSGKDLVGLREQLKMVADRGRGGTEAGQAPRTTMYDIPETGIEEFDRKVREARFHQWLSDRCQSGLSDKPNWLDSPRYSMLPTCAH